MNGHVRRELNTVWVISGDNLLRSVMVFGKKRLYGRRRSTEKKKHGLSSTTVFAC